MGDGLRPGEPLGDVHALMMAVANGLHEVLCVKDLDGRYILGNEALVRLLGLSTVNDVLGRTDADLLPDDADRIMAADHEVIASGMPRRYEQTLHLPSGPRTYLSTKSPLRDEEGRILGVIVLSTDITARTEAEEELRAERDLRTAAARRVERLHAIVGSLSGAVSPADVAHAIVEEGRVALGADSGSVYRMGEDGDLEPLATAGEMSARVDMWGNVASEARRVLAGRAVAEGVLVMEGRDAIVALVPALRDDRRVPDVTVLAASLTLDASDPLGVVLFGFQRHVPISQEDRAFVDRMAHQCAQALERARLYEAEARARRRADRASTLTRRLYEATAALSGATTEAEVARTILDHALEALEAQAGGVLFPSPDGKELELVMVAGGAVGDVYRRRRGVPVDATIALSEAYRTGGIVCVGSAAEWRERFPEGAAMFTDIAEAVVCLPLPGEGRPIGVIGLLYDEPRSFARADLDTALTLAEQGAQALVRARLYEAEREVATVLQHSMLSPELPDTGRLRVAARYRSAVREMEVGGDWFEVLPLPSGRVGVAIGDVVGRGLQAATTMGQLRSALRALALSDLGPAQVVERLDAFAAVTPGATMATLVYGEVGEDARSFRFTCAGHCPPLVVDPTGGASFLEEPRNTSLGVSNGGPNRSEGTVALPEGSTLVLYSDGLIERRRESIDAGLERLARLAADRIGSDPGSFSDELIAGLLEGQRQTDDVAVLCVRTPHDLGSPLILAVPARSPELSKLRRTMRAWLADAGVGARIADDIVLACGEAAANAIEHAYDGVEEGTVEVSLAIEGGGTMIVASVKDQGRWRAHGVTSGRGRGIPLIEALVDDVDLRPETGGTMVTMRKAIPEEHG